MSVEQYPSISIDDEVERLVDTENVSYAEAYLMLGVTKFEVKDVPTDAATITSDRQHVLSPREQRRQEDYKIYETLYHQTGDIRLTPEQQIVRQRGYAAASKAITDYFGKKA